MDCPECGGQTCVIDSRIRPEYHHRRRKCLSCGLRFNTREKFVDAPKVDIRAKLHEAIDKVLKEADYGEV